MHGFTVRRRKWESRGESEHKFAKARNNCDFSRTWAPAHAVNTAIRAPRWGPLQGPRPLTSYDAAGLSATTGSSGLT